MLLLRNQSVTARGDNPTQAFRVFSRTWTPHMTYKQFYLNFVYNVHHHLQTLLIRTSVRWWLRCKSSRRSSLPNKRVTARHCPPMKLCESRLSHIWKAHSAKRSMVLANRDQSYKSNHKFLLFISALSTHACTHNPGPTYHAKLIT